MLTLTLLIILIFAVCSAPVFLSHTSHTDGGDGIFDDR
jgi:hypothetical protein